MEYTFDNIRPYRDAEVQKAVAKLVKEADFKKVVQFLYKEQSAQVLENLKNARSINDFQVTFVKPVLESIIKNTTSGVSFSGQENLPRDKACLFISNHRDIVMDPALIDYGLHLNGMDMVEIAIGSNLLIKPWIEIMVKLNRCFIVRRGVYGRELLLSSRNISSYIHNTIRKRNEHVWIAQREGRAKDGDDRTHSGILRMLNMGSGEKNPAVGLSTLNIVPISISYEYDPCDILKAKELAAKAAGKKVIKTQEDDLQSMTLGMNGYKGKVHIHFSKPINDDILALNTTDPQELINEISVVLDKAIHKGLRIFSSNKAAAALAKPDKFNASTDDIAAFRAYIEKQLKTYNADARLIDFIILQYANPAFNAFSVLG